jgi:excisionase family DNA binding protein
MEVNMNDLPEKKWLTLVEVQQILGLGRTKTYELTATGEIPAVKIGRVLRVNREELDGWLETKRVIDPAER